MQGMDRRTGRMIDGESHLTQSLHNLFTTRIGERVMRRFLGVNSTLIDVPMTSGFAGLWVYELVTALNNANETRFEITEGNVTLIDSQGHAHIKLTGQNLEVFGTLDVILNSNV